MLKLREWESAIFKWSQFKRDVQCSRCHWRLNTWRLLQYFHVQMMTVLLQGCGQVYHRKWFYAPWSSPAGGSFGSSNFSQCDFSSFYLSTLAVKPRPPRLLKCNPLVILPTSFWRTWSHMILMHGYGIVGLIMAFRLKALATLGKSRGVTKMIMRLLQVSILLIYIYIYIYIY